MRRFVVPVLLFMLTGNCWRHGWAAESPSARVAETKYLVFQVWPRMPGYPGLPSTSARFTLGKAEMEGFVRDVSQAIGITGDARHKLGFAVGPFSFDVADDDARQWIRDAFAVARENDVAVAIHLDDSMSWGERKDLLANPDNIEAADWKLQPSTGRRLDWGPSPTKFPPQMCYNAPAVVSAAKARAGLLGAEIKRELETLKAQEKEYLFAGVIAGSETQISRDYDTSRALGFRALAHRGFSEANPPKDIDAERVSVVKEWMKLWADGLHAAGTPREKIFCHIAFTDQGLRKPTETETYAERVAFAVPEVAFSSAYRPGFSTYPEGRTFKEVYSVLEKHGSPGWISAEGTNVSPTSMPGEPTMETYLGRMFNHGAVLTNVFSWGIGGEALRESFFRQATENPECLAAYAKFLRGEPLVESAATGFSSEAFQAKMRRIQAELPPWVQKTGKQAQAMPLIQKVQSLIKEKQWQAADQAADQVLALMKGESPETPRPKVTTVAMDLPAKIQKIQQSLPGWIDGDRSRERQAIALMRELEKNLQGQDLAAAEKTADAVLKLLGASGEGR
ncbi:MAG: hypothetical protein JSS27_15170 [Planctomycetes bacterium]|nr:hypothetical protein [Planctomycetota bacterium]